MESLSRRTELDCETERRNAASVIGSRNRHGPAGVAADAVDGLAWWTSIPGNPNPGGVLVHGGTDTFDFKGVRVLPWFLR